MSLINVQQIRMVCLKTTWVNLCESYFFCEIKGVCRNKTFFLRRPNTFRFHQPVGCIGGTGGKYLTGSSHSLCAQSFSVVVCSYFYTYCVLPEEVARILNTTRRWVTPNGDGCMACSTDCSTGDQSWYYDIDLDSSSWNADSRTCLPDLAINCFRLQIYQPSHTLHVCIHLYASWHA